MCYTGLRWRHKHRGTLRSEKKRKSPEVTKVYVVTRKGTYQRRGHARKPRSHEHHVASEEKITRKATRRWQHDSLRLLCLLKQGGLKINVLTTKLAKSSQLAHHNTHKELVHLACPTPSSVQYLAFSFASSFFFFHSASF